MESGNEKTNKLEENHFLLTYHDLEDTIFHWVFNKYDKDKDDNN